VQDDVAMTTVLVSLEAEQGDPLAPRRGGQFLHSVV
jgi:hypothetical protein